VINGEQPTDTVTEQAVSLIEAERK
jgi:hypothetical protein